MNATRRGSSSWLTRIANLPPRMTVVVIILSALLSCGIYWAWSWFSHSDHFPLRHVTIRADASYVPGTTLRKTVAAHLQGGFFDFDAAALNTALLRLPWVKSVSFERRWPDTLRINVIEKEPLARFGHRGVITKDHALFFLSATQLTSQLSSLRSSLPQLFGPDDELDNILSHFDQLTVQLGVLDLSIARLTLTSRLTWRLVLSNGIQLRLGRQDIQQRLRRFIGLYPTLIGKKRAGAVKYVDLRYPNGFALRWKQ